jgi:hypothetical protein
MLPFLWFGWMQLQFFSALIHSVKDLGTTTRSLLQDMCSSVCLPDMVLQHMQRVVSQHMQRMVLQHMQRMALHQLALQ